MKRHPLILLGLLVLLAACATDAGRQAAPESPPEPASSEGMPSAPTVSEQPAAEGTVPQPQRDYGPDAVKLLEAGEKLPPSDSGAGIQEAALRGDRLALHVMYSGGGTEHEFRLVSPGALMKSLPPQLDLYLIHDARGDERSVPIAEELYFDLRPIKDRYGGPVVLRLHAGTSSRLAVPALEYAPR